MINIGTSKIYPWGWRLSLGLCMVPATTLLLGGIFLDDTPNSLCERGHPEKVCMMSSLWKIPSCDEQREKQPCIIPTYSRAWDHARVIEIYSMASDLICPGLAQDRLDFVARI